MDESRHDTYTILKTSILSKPRMMGTSAEKRTEEFIKDHLHRIGLSPYTEQIQWSRSFVFARKVLGVFLIPWLFLFNHSLGLDGTQGGVLAIAFVIASIIFLTLSLKAIQNDRFSHLGKSTPGVNVICDIEPLERGHSQKRIYVTAHTDSVSSSLPELNMPLTIGGFLFFLLALVTTAIGGILSLNGSASGFKALELVREILLQVSIIGCILIISGLFAKRVNTSPGAIDNGSGSAILLTIAEHFGKNPLQNISLRFIFFTAEEWGLYGSKGYVTAHQDELIERADKDLLINVDMVGSELAYVEKAGLILKKPLNKGLNVLIGSTAARLGIEARAYNTLLGNNSDHAPFRKLKMETAFFFSKKDTKRIHKPLDTLDGVDPKILEDAVLLLSALIQDLDQAHHQG